MVSFRDILRLDGIGTSVKAGTKEEVLAMAVEFLAQSGRIRDKAALFASLLEREDLSSTAIGAGVAVPHVLCDDIEETELAVLRLEKPIPFGGLDGEPVDLVFATVGPKGDTMTHLKLLSRLARLLHEESFRKRLRQAKDGASLAEIFYETPL